MPFKEIKATVQQQVRAAEREIATVEKFRGYPSLPGDESDTELDMQEPGATGGNFPLTQHNERYTNAKDGPDRATSPC